MVVVVVVVKCVCVWRGAVQSTHLACARGEERGWGTPQARWMSAYSEFAGVGDAGVRFTSC